MGQLQTKERKHAHVRRIIDKVFDKFAGRSGESKLNFHELYVAILVVYNDINKKLPGPHNDPPTREEVQKLLEEFDTNANGVLDRAEFAAFLEKFTKNLSKGVSKSLLVYAMSPILALVTKRATEQIPRVGPVVRRIPNFAYATLVTTVVAIVGHQKQIED